MREPAQARASSVDAERATGPAGLVSIPMRLPRKPSPLRHGDRVALVAPSGAWDAQRLARGVELLESWGLDVTVRAPGGALRYLAGGDAERGRLIGEALAAPDVRGVLAVRGGYGAARLHRWVDLAAACRDPKLFVGFSDVTILLNRLVQEAGVIAYHGPMIAADLPRLSAPGKERFRRFLFGEDGWFSGAARETWRDGAAEGRLVGGCLSVLVTTLGTPYEVDTSGAVLFLEDVAEKPYRIDRMLSHMKDAGKLRDVCGIVLGPMLDCDGGEGSAILREIFLDVLADTDVPIVYGIDAGHGTENVVLPFGCRVRLTGDAPGLELLEPVFA
jgi:muramoyltetrapeptide carboxypeptidase